MISNPSIDFLIRIKNAYVAGKKSVSCPATKFVLAIAEILKKHNYIGQYQVEKSTANQSTLVVELIYIDKKPAVSQIEIYSTPGRRLYCDSTNIPWGTSSRSLIIISSSSGLISQKQAQKQHIGGELLAQVY